MVAPSGDCFMFIGKNRDFSRSKLRETFTHVHAHMADGAATLIKVASK